MKKVLFGLLFITGGFTFLNSCSTDFDLYADYKDISVVYGLLDTSDDTSWIKITKAFTGPGNALLIAKNPDSSNYSYKLDVKLQGVKNGNNLPPIVFDTITIHNKRPGDSTFYFPDQVVYFAKTGLDYNAKYKLIINNDGKEITSETDLVGDFTISRPNKFISFTNDSEIKWSLAENGKRYEVFLVFNYQELIPGNADTLNKKTTWFLGTDTDDNGSRAYVGETFYNLLETELESIPNVKRWAGTVNLIVACGSEILNNYLEINEADNSLLTEVPVYTNIKGGTGVFASRHSTFKDVLLTPKSIEMLVEDYPGLGFRYPVK
ncbi:MAG: hypothetical protein L3J31_02670 [Bacteroidales bacterium]|nr:hypothetical protein [Bacteroidales bacterium]MCF6341694.1 hypothetical protein [Bacteroidales bacterium]